MGYLLNSGTGFYANAIQVDKGFKDYLLQFTGYYADTVDNGPDDVGDRILADGGSFDGYACAADAINALEAIASPTNAVDELYASAIDDGAIVESYGCFYDDYIELENIDIE